MPNIQSFLEEENKEFEKFVEEETMIDWRIAKDFLPFFRSHDERLLGKVRELFPEESEDFMYISEDVREFARQLRDSLDSK